MKTISSLIQSLSRAAALTFILAAGLPVCGQDNPEAAHARGVDLKGANVRGADVKGGDVRGGTVTGGSVTGGSVTGGSVTGGSATAGTVTAGTVTASANGRQIQVSALEPTTVNVNGSNAEVKVGDQILLVEKAKLVLDGKPLGDMPPETKKIEVTVKEGVLSVIGDGKELARAKLPSPPPQ